MAGEVAEGDLGPGARIRVAFELTAGDGLEVVAGQEGADVALVVVEPGGQTRLRLDRPVGRTEPERLVFVAQEAGTHLVEVESLESSGEGSYHLEVVALEPATSRTRRLAVAIEHLAAGHELRRAGAAGEAVERYRQAAEEWRALRDRGMEADALAWMAWGLDREGRWEPAAEALERAVRGFRAARDAEREADALGDLGSALRHLGRADEALDRYHESLDLWRRLDDAAGQARTLTQLANLHKARNELSATELYYKEAIALWERLDRPRDVAITLANLAGVYCVAGQPELALDLLARASDLLSSGSPRDRAFVLNETGLAYRLTEEPTKARGAYRRALSLYEEVGSSEGAVAALDGLARLEYEEEDYRSALELYRDLLPLVETEEASAREASYLQNLGWIHLLNGEPEKALPLFRRALPALQEAGFSAVEAATLAGIARFERELGHLEAASSWAERSLDVLEELRGASDRLDLRSSLLATNLSYFDFAVDTLMERHRRDPAAGFDRLAFEVSERARARGLLDALPGTNLSTTVPAVTEVELDRLRRRVNAAEESRLRLLTAGAGEAELGRAERALRAALEELRSARGRVRSVRTKQGAAPQPLSLAEVQRSVLEPDTLLLSYDLGEERSYLWAVSSDEIATFILPGAEVLEQAARDTHDLLAHSHQRASSYQVEIEAARLSQWLLDPVATLVREHRRLLIAAEGDLHTVPFGALPDPSGSGEPLLARHEIAHAPSASVLAWLGARPPSGTGGPRKLFAVVADPVFGPDDDRLRGKRVAGGADGAAAPPASLGGADLDRLPFSSDEADALSGFVDADDLLVAKDFSARKELVTGGRLADFRILHFATHGSFSSEHPELSALVLSRFDEAGRPRDGVLWAHEISALRLPAELVVLSACDSGLGSEIHGEGLVGLSHAFFRAGAPRVVVSLWRVNDAAAVELMTRFYSGLLDERLPAADALRRAQLSMRAETRWERPFYWAGFVLQGDW